MQPPALIASAPMNEHKSHQFLIHGAAELPSVGINGYNIGLRDKEGFIGDRANTGAFLDKLEELRKLFRKQGDDPLGEASTDEFKRKQIDNLLTGDDLRAAALVHGAIEEFAQSFAAVIRRYLRTDTWKGTERIAIGGGFKESRVGKLAIARAEALLKAEKVAIQLRPIRHHPDEAGLIGSLHLMPAWSLAGHDGILAVDIGGKNIRAGVVLSHIKDGADLAKAEVWKSELWHHVDDEPARGAAIERMVEMLHDLIARAQKEKLVLAPVIGVGCPGVIKPDGSIAWGGQNLPGSNWESPKFNLPAALTKAIPEIAGEPTYVILHNDAVVQGLSEVPFMQDVKRWGVLTIGTGLGNARYTNKAAKQE
jgi:hypothetical protein